MPQENPLVSIAITNYNYGGFIARAIRSVLKQTFEDFEIVVVDNASTDNSVEVVRGLMDTDPRIRLVVNPENIGTVRNHQRSADVARGTYLVHLDADDWIIDPDALKFQVEMLNNNPDVSFVFSPIVDSGPEDQAIVETRPFFQDTIVPGEIGIKHVIMRKVASSGPMVRMSALRKFNGYNLDYEMSCDLKLVVDLCGQGKVGYIDRPLYCIFSHPNRASSVAKAAVFQTFMCNAIESAFTGPLKGRIAGAERCRRQALSLAMLVPATGKIFSDQYLDGWSMVLDSVRRRPLIALAVKPLLVLSARTILGNWGWEQLERVKGRGPVDLAFRSNAVGTQKRADFPKIG